MNCEICKCSVNERMLHRTKPIGQSNGGWTCLPCIENNEPELAKNIKTESDFSLLKDIEEICIKPNNHE